MQPSVGGEQYGLQRGPYLAKGGRGGVRVPPGFWLGSVGILWRKGIGQADADTGLAQEWPREPDASAKDA
jgi:hypothetical protein